MPIVDMKQMGIGLVAAVLIDPTIIGGILLPAAMKLLGDSNSYLPRSIRWLPLEHASAHTHGSRIRLGPIRSPAEKRRRHPSAGARPYVLSRAVT